MTLLFFAFSFRFYRGVETDYCCKDCFGASQQIAVFPEESESDWVLSTRLVLLCCSGLFWCSLLFLATSSAKVSQSNKNIRWRRLTPDEGILIHFFLSTSRFNFSLITRVVRLTCYREFGFVCQWRILLLPCSHDRLLLIRILESLSKAQPLSSLANPPPAYFSHRISFRFHHRLTAEEKKTSIEEMKTFLLFLFMINFSPSLKENKNATKRRRNWWQSKEVKDCKYFTVITRLL